MSRRCVTVVEAPCSLPVARAAATIGVIAGFAVVGVADEPQRFRLEYQPGVALELSSSRFHAERHNIRRCRIANWTGVCIIDGRPVFGADWQMPTNTLDRVVLEVRGMRIELDASSMYEPWTDRPSKKAFAVVEIEGRWAVCGSFSDGAGSYVAEWRVIDGVPIRTILSDAESLDGYDACRVGTTGSGRTHVLPRDAGTRPAGR